MWPLLAVFGLIAIAAIAAALYFALRENGDKSSQQTTPVTTPGGPTVANPLNKLPGVRKVKAPWLPEYAHLADRLAPLKLNALSQEALAYHIHQHLDIFRNGKKVAVPPGIGINDGAYLTELHTHDPSGVIHVEAESSKLRYTLGSFFAEWGLWLDSRCVGGYCQGYAWYVNGKRQTGNAWDLELQPHQEIALVIGAPPTKIPSTYAWAGL
jgi:hypothetical protein